MGSINNFIDNLDDEPMSAMESIHHFLFDDEELSIAMEADDITKAVKNSTNIAFKGKGESAKANDTTDIDTNTDDILGIATKKDDTDLEEDDDTTNEDENDTSDEDTSDDDSSNTDVDSDKDSGEDDDLDNNSDDNTLSEDSDENADETSPDEQKKKMLLHENMLYLYDILKSDIEVLSDYAPNTQDNDVIKTLQNVKSNLEDTLGILSNILKNEFDDVSYPLLLRKYIGIKTVYDITIKMLDGSFTKLTEQLVLKKPVKKSSTR